MTFHMCMDLPNRHCYFRVENHHGQLFYADLSYGVDNTYEEGVDISAEDEGGADIVYLLSVNNTASFYRDLYQGGAEEPLKSR